jgi:DNA-binding MarR family transcriptional regulator
MSAGKPDLTVVGEDEPDSYHVEQQVGFVLRKATQRHVAIFSKHIADLTPPQFAALSKLGEVGEISQNQLGLLVAMDAATIKGVIDRLKGRDLVGVKKHAVDKRRLMVQLTGKGRALVAELTPFAEKITAETLGPLAPREAATLLKLLSRLG